MAEATQLASKKIIGAPIKLYKLFSVSDTNTLTTDFGTVQAAFVSIISGNPSYLSTIISGSKITFYNDIQADLDVLVWGE